MQRHPINSQLTEPTWFGIDCENTMKLDAPAKGVGGILAIMM
jgi:hypothetical protein